MKSHPHKYFCHPHKYLAQLWKILRNQFHSEIHQRSQQQDVKFGVI